LFPLGNFKKNTVFRLEISKKYFDFWLAKSKYRAKIHKKEKKVGA
jgi:hypothetical protein